MSAPPEASGAVVRLATRDDRNGAVALWRQLQADHEAQDVRYRVSEDAEARWTTDFRSWTRSHTNRVWVAEAPNGALVGLLTAMLADPSPMYRGLPFVFVTDLVTDRLWRGQGIATALLRAAREWAREIGAGEIRAGVLSTNPRGRAFWAREGARDFNVTVVIPLDPRG